MRRNRNLPWRIIDSFLIVSLLAAQPNVAAYAAEGSDPGIVSITSEDDFVLLTENCKTESFSTGKTFRLDADLDLSNYENLFLPVMDGTFDGNGHQIIGVTLSEEMSDYGLFRYVTENGVVKNLTVEGEILGGDEQENIGILAGSNAGAIENCITRGTLNAETAVGGITGKNEETGSVSRSENEAAIDGKMQTRGIAGLNEGGISDCVNSGKINTNQKIKKQAEGDGSSVNISIPNAVTGLTADERANETGGIAGNSSGDISYCTNTATIGFERLGSSTGGIVGRQLGSLSYCANKGVVYGHKNVGGISGVLEPYEESSYDRDYRQELSDELDRLGDLIDDVSNQGEKLGDNLSDNADLLSDQLKTLRNSLRGYMDDYSDMASDGKDAIHDNVKSMKKTIDGMQYDVKIKQLNTAIEQISNDIAQMEKIMEQLKPYVDQGNAKLDGLFKQYEEKIQGWIDSIDDLKQYQENLPEEAPDEVTPAAPTPDEGAADTQTTSEDQTGSDSAASEDSSTVTKDSSTASEDSNTASEDSSTVTEDSNTASGDSSTVTEDSNTASGDSSTATEDSNTASDDSGDVPAANSSSDSSSSDDSSASGDGNDQASTGRMIPVTYRVVTSTTLPDGTKLPDVNIPDVQVPSELTAALQQLQALSKDVRTQMSTIAGLLGEMPGQTNQLMSDIKSITGSMDKMTDELDDILDDFDDEMDTMKDDLRQKGNTISDTLDNTSDTLHADFDGVRDSIDRVKDQFDVIRGTVSDALDELKNRIDDKSIYVDVSELTDATAGDGKIISSTNSGEVYADTQGGGIAGAIAKTNPQKASAWFFQDKNDDEDDDEDDSDSITRHVLAAIFSSSNTADITVKGDYAGGIVGKADYGIIVAAENYGDILTDGGKYAGGIAGRCDNTIRDSYVLSGVSGDGYVGGVAGRGEDVSGNYVCSYLDMDSYVKSSGAVVGKADGVVKDNYFVDNGYGAVDGVTRSSEAESMDYDSLIQLGNMPLNFTQFTVRFMNGEQVVWQNTFAYGDELPEENYPDLPKSKDGYVYWEEKDVSPIHRNVTVHAVYRAYMPALTADAEAEKSPVLMGGEFYPDTKISVREATDEELAQVKANIDNDSPFYKYYLKKVYYYEVSQAQPLRTNAIVRVLNDTRLADSLMTMDAEYQTVGEAQKADTIGSYLSSDTQISSAGYIVVLNRMDIWVETLISAAVLALAILVVVGLHIRRQKRRNAAKAAAEAAVTKETDDETVKPEE